MHVVCLALLSLISEPKKKRGQLNEARPLREQPECDTVCSIVCQIPSSVPCGVLTLGCSARSLWLANRSCRLVIGVMSYRGVAIKLVPRSRKEDEGNIVVVNASLWKAGEATPSVCANRTEHYAEKQGRWGLM
jgi:hypothetical protein